MNEVLQEKTTYLDDKDLAMLADKGLKISLIKELRHVSGMGLKDSKDGVEGNCYKGGVIDPDKTIAYFNQFRPKAKPTPKPLTEDQKVINGLRVAMKHWSVLGFRSKHAACDMVLCNIL